LKLKLERKKIEKAKYYCVRIPRYQTPRTERPTGRGEPMITIKNNRRAASGRGGVTSAATNDSSSCTGTARGEEIKKENATSYRAPTAARSIVSLWILRGNRLR